MGAEPERADLEAARAELLEPIAEVAIAVARRDGADTTAPIPPKALHPYLRFAKLPTAALGAAISATDADEGFRARVAEACAGDDELTDGQRAWLVRDDGWEDRFGGEVEAAAADHAERRAARTGSELRDRIAELERDLADRDRRLAEVERELARLKRTAEEHEAQVADLGAERDGWATRAGEAEEARRRAVRELKVTEARSVDRLDRVRRLEAELEELAARSGRVEEGDGSAPGTAPGPAGVPAEVLQPLAEHLAGLAEDLSALVASAASPPTATAASAPDVPGPAPRRAARARRRPLRLQHGIVDGTPEAADQLIATPGVLVLVDGWNVSMLGWPDLPGPLQRQRLVDALGGVAARTGAEVHVVFDGIDSGSGPVAHGAGRVRVQFTPEGVEADDRILELVDAIPPERHVIVVSNDRRVRTGAGERAANVVGSTELLALLTRR